MLEGSVHDKPREDEGESRSDIEQNDDIHKKLHV